MPDLPLNIEDLPGSREGIRILRLSGPLTLAMYLGSNLNCAPTFRGRSFWTSRMFHWRIRLGLGRWLGRM